MSNIGFMQSCTKSIVELYNKYFSSSKTPSKSDKEDYKNLMIQLDLMYTHGEIEDEELYHRLRKVLNEHDITRVVEQRKRMRGK